MTTRTTTTTTIQPEAEGQIEYPEVTFEHSADEERGTLAIQPKGHDRYSTDLSKDDARALALVLLDFADGYPVEDRHKAYWSDR